MGELSIQLQQSIGPTTTIDCIDPLYDRSAMFIPTIEYGQTERAGQALVGGFLSLYYCSLSVYFAPTCLSMGELSRINTTIDRYDDIYNIIFILSE